MLRDIEQLLARDRAARAAVVAAAVWLSTAFNLGLALYDQRLAYLVYWAEIAGFSTMVGTEAGGLALLGTTICALFFFVPPAFSFRIDTTHDAALIGGYLLIGVAIWGAAAVWRRSKGRELPASAAEVVHHPGDMLWRREFRRRPPLD